MQDEIEDMETLHDRAAERGRNKSKKPISDVIPALVIQSHHQVDRVGEICWMRGLLEGESVSLGRNIPDFCEAQSLIGTPLSDPYLSRSPIQIRLLAQGEIEFDNAQSNIELIINGAKVEKPTVFSTTQLAHGLVIQLGSRVTLLLTLLQHSEGEWATRFDMVGVSSQLQAVQLQLQRLKGLEEPVLIRGPTGVGKELVAEAVFNSSGRVNKPFIRLNLASLSSSIATAELFGVKKGAFTGAEKDRPGYLVAADEGTLFLDEIGEASPEVQSMLLRVLENGELYPVGSSTPRQVNVRLIAATDANLERLCEEKRFSLALYHRLAGYEIRLPPLHERREDIGPLFLHFCKQQFSQLDPQHPFRSPYAGTALMPGELMALLLNYHWPGNIRQLKNIARQIVIDNRERGEVLISQQIRDQLSAAPKPETEVDTLTIKPKRRKPRSVSAEELRQALIENDWELQATAEKLNITRSSIYELIERFGFKTSTDLTTVDIEQSYQGCNGNIDEMVIELEISRHSLLRRIKELGIEHN